MDYNTKYLGLPADQKSRLQQLEDSLKIAQQRRDCARVEYIRYENTTEEDRIAWDRYITYRKDCLEIEEKIRGLITNA